MADPKVPDPPDEIPDDEAEDEEIDPNEIAHWLIQGDDEDEGPPDDRSVSKQK